MMSYTTSEMPLHGQKTTVNEDGVDKDAYTVVFTNGALKELEDLQASLKLDDIDTVLKVGIALLTKMEETKDGSKQ